jgi:CRP-like cAMP-binding protein
MNAEQELVAALQSIPWFQEIESEHFEQLVNIARLRTVDAGEELFREGDQEDFLYIVLEGRIALEMYVPGKGRVRFYTAEPLDIVGWSSVTPVIRQRTAGARAVLPSLLIAFDSLQLRILCERDPRLGYIVMRRLANVVASRLLVTRLQLIDMFANPCLEVGHD